MRPRTFGVCQTARPLAAIVLAALLPPAASAQSSYGSHGNVCASIDAATRAQVEELSVRFKAMIGAARTEAMMVRESVRWAQARGFRRWDPMGAAPQAGDRFYAVNRDRTIVLWVQGSEPLTAGIRLINSHVVERLRRLFRKLTGAAAAAFRSRASASVQSECGPQ